MIYIVLTVCLIFSNYISLNTKLSFKRSVHRARDTQSEDKNRNYMRDFCPTDVPIHYYRIYPEYNRKLDRLFLIRNLSDLAISINTYVIYTYKRMGSYFNRLFKVHYIFTYLSFMLYLFTEYNLFLITTLTLCVYSLIYNLIGYNYYDSVRKDWLDSDLEYFGYPLKVTLSCLYQLLVYFVTLSSLIPRV